MELRWNSRKLTAQKLRELLRDVPDDQAAKVELIDLYNNALEFLPRELFDVERFPRVLDLDVSGNKLKFLPTAIGKHRLESLYTTDNPMLPEKLQQTCHHRVEAQQLQQDIIVNNRAADRATARALLLLCEHRFGEPESPIRQMPRDIVVLVAKYVWADAK